MRLMYRLLLLAFLLALVTPTHAQDRYLELHARYARPTWYADAFVLPGEKDPVAFFTVRIPNSLLVFVRERDGNAVEPFLARVELTVQVRRGGVLVREQVWQAEHRAASYEATVSDSLDFEAQIAEKLPAGDYAYRVEVRDLTADRRLVSDVAALEAPAFGLETIGPPILAKEAPGPSGRITPSNLGGNLAFFEGGWLLVPVVAAADGRALAYEIRALSPSQERPRPRPARSRGARPGDEMREEWEAPRSAIPAPPDVADTPVVAKGEISSSDWVPFAAVSAVPESRTYTGVETSTAGASVFLVPIRVDAVGQRERRFHVTVRLVDSDADPRSATFGLRWRGMPIALHDAETAIRLLSFIEPAERVRTLLRGNSEEREAAIRNYWEARDPTPDTPYNELMVEYYRRIDYAAQAFRTGGGALPNGLRTDQAHAYIVNGPPDDVERTFPEGGGVEELWTYRDGRRFLFWAASSLEPLALQR